METINAKTPLPTLESITGIKDFNLYLEKLKELQGLLLEIDSLGVKLELSKVDYKLCG